jgi:hypothetical protein
VGGEPEGDHHPVVLSKRSRCVLPSPVLNEVLFLKVIAHDLSGVTKTWEDAMVAWVWCVFRYWMKVPPT